MVSPQKKNSPSSEVTPVKQRPAAASESVTAPEQYLAASAPRCPSTPGLGTPGTQALTDLVDLAEEGMTLTQYRYTGENLSTPGAHLIRSCVSALVVSRTETDPTCLLLSADNDLAAAEPPLSGFVLEPTETPGPPINQVTLHLKPPLSQAEML